MQNEYRYFAFISYKREDEKWARWLQKRLESYRLPSIIRKEVTNQPKYIRPVFMDKTDLGASALTESLHHELEQSKFIIVICSPRSAKSEWVGHEIEHFIELGREKEVIPFIIEGTPHSGNPDTECFNPVFSRFKDEPLGANIHEVGRECAFIKVAARLLGLRFDTLWNRQRRRLRNRRILSGCIAALLALLCFFTWDYSRTTSAYYTDYVDCWGLPAGIHPLIQAQVSHREGSYRFDYKRIPFGEPGAWNRRLASISYVNSAGTAQENTNKELQERHAIQTFEYNKEDGCVVRINYCDAHGKILLRHTLSEKRGTRAAIADFVNAKEQKGATFIAAQTTSIGMDDTRPTAKSNIIRYAYQRNNAGCITQVTYHANNDLNLSRSAVCDGEGIFGKKYTLDSLGRHTRVHYIGMEGQPCCNRLGVAGYETKYDTQGNIYCTTYFDLAGNPALNEEMWSTCAIEHDEWGNAVKVSCLGVDGKPCFHREGWSSLRSKFDSQGNLTETACFAPDGSPCLCNNGYSRCTVEYDNHGNATKLTSYGSDGEPCLTNDGICSLSIKYDSNNQMVERLGLSTDGKPCLSKEGFCKMKLTYEQGLTTEASFFDTNDKPCVTAYLFSRRTSRYDDSGNEVERTFFGTDGKPCNADEGYACWRAIYDERGNIVEESFFDTQGNPCFGKDFYSKSTIRFDEQGNLVEQRFHDINDSLCLNSSWFAITTREYDANGNLLHYAFFDDKGEPCYLKGELISSCKQQFDQRGNAIQCRYFDTAGNPCLNNSGYSIANNSYDEWGRLVEESYFDADSLPCLRDNGYHKSRIIYDERGNAIRFDYYDSKGERTLFKGAATILNEYDRQNHLIRQAYLDIAGKPCLSKEGFGSYSIKYNERGLATETSFYDTQGELVENRNYYAMEQTEYDERGNATEVRYYNAQKQLSVMSGNAIIRIKHDAFGNIIERSFFNEKEEPMGGSFFKHIEKYYYNGTHQCTKIELYDNDSALVACEDILLDEFGHLTGNRFSDGTGNTADLSNLFSEGEFNYATSRCSNNEFGHVTEILYFNSKGEPCEPIARMTMERNRRGEVIRSESYNSSEELENSPIYNSAIVVKGYDIHDNLTEQSYYDKNYNLAITPWGWSRRLQQFDDKGICIKDSYYRYLNGEWVIDTYPKQSAASSVPTMEQTATPPTILMSVEDYGQFVNAGLTGQFHLLEFNDWNMYKGLDAFAEALNGSRSTKKRMLFFNDNTNEVIAREFNEEKLGVRFMDDNTLGIYEKCELIYKQWKATGK